jgi:hypothetical protein
LRRAPGIAPTGFRVTLFAERTLAQHSAPARGLAASSLARAALAFGLILAWCALIRLPYFNHSAPDDGFFTEVALLWRQGQLPYVSAFDIKPPGFFAVLALSQSLFGAGFAALRAVGTLSDAATVGLMVYLAGRYGAPGVGLFAALLFPWFSQVVIADDSYSFLIAVTTAAMAIGLSGLPTTRKAALAGLALGAACTVKQTAVFEGVALLAILFGEARSADQRARVVAAFVAAAALAPLAFVADFAAHGALAPMLADVVGVALSRPGAESDHVSLLGGLARFVYRARDMLPVLIAAAATGLLQAWMPRPRAPIPALSAWFAAALVGALVQRALYATYLGPLMAPALLLSGFGGAALLRVRPALARGARLCTIGLALFEAAASLASTAARWRSGPNTLDGLAAAIQAERPRAEDRLYVTQSGSTFVWLYALTGLRPATPFFIPLQSMCDFPGAGPERLVEAFAARPRFVVVGVKESRYNCERENASAAIEAALSSGYRRIARVACDDRHCAKSEDYSVYEITTPSAQ